MQPLSKDYEGSVLEIKTMDNDLLATGRIAVLTEEYLQVGTYQGEKLPILRLNLPVKISVHNAKLGFRVLAGVVFLSTDGLLKITDVDNLQDFERRSFFRVPIKDMSAVLIREPKDDTEAVTAAEEIPIWLDNVSLSGLLFTPKDTKREFLVGERFMVELSLPKNKIAMNVRICRSEQHGLKPRKYGCEFFDYTQKQSDKLCNFIFETEREIMRKKKNG